MCVLYVSVGSKVRPRPFGCVAMGIVMLLILRSRLLLYAAWSGMKVVLCGFSVRVLCIFGYTRACVCRCDGDVICVRHDLNRWSGWW